MKPRTKEQEKLVEWSVSFPALTDKQWVYAIKHCFPNTINDMVFTNRCWAYCPATNKVWKAGPMKDVKSWSELKAKETNHKSLKVCQKSHDFCRTMFMILTTKGGYQAARWFQLTRTIKIHWGKTVTHHVSYTINDVGVEWVAPDGRSFSVERPRCNSWYYVDIYSDCGSMELRKDSSFAKFCTPYATLVQSILPIVRRNGWTKKIAQKFESWPFDLIRGLLSSREFEACIKNGHYAVAEDYLQDYNYYLRHMLANKPEVLNDYKLILKLANRQHIKFDEKVKWSDMKDYYRDLVYLHKDVHNPSILFPKDFKEAHLRVAKRAQKVRDEQLRRRRERQHLEEMEAKAHYCQSVKEWVAKYTKMFQTLDITDGEFEITPLITTSDFKGEADVMHHCIETYYGKADTLLLSIMHDGIKAETAEINLLKEGRVIQCRGRNNASSPYHAEIVALLYGYMDVFVERYRKYYNKKRVINLPAPLSMWAA